MPSGVQGPFPPELRSLPNAVALDYTSSCRGDNFASVMNCDANIWYAGHLMRDPCKKVIWPPKGSWPTGWEPLLYTLLDSDNIKPKQVTYMLPTIRSPLPSDCTRLPKLSVQVLKSAEKSLKQELYRQRHLPSPQRRVSFLTSLNLFSHHQNTSIVRSQ